MPGSRLCAVHAQPGALLPQTDRSHHQWNLVGPAIPNIGDIMTLRVILQIVPMGDETNSREIGRLDIFNKGAIEFGHCEYGVIDLTPKQEGLYELPVIHRRDLGAWKLVSKVLNIFEPTG